MELILKLNSQQKVSALGELLLIAAKSPSVSDEGMRIALDIIDDLKAAVAAANAPVDNEQGAA